MDNEGKYLITYVKTTDALLNAMILIPNNAAQCWLNSLMQLLLSLPAFSASIGHQYKKWTDEGKSHDDMYASHPLAHFYCGLLYYLEQQIGKNPGALFITMPDDSVLITNFNNAFYNAYPGEGGYDFAGQQDLFELFTVFLDCLGLDDVTAKFLNVYTRRFHCNCGAVKKIISHNFFVNMAGSDFDKMNASDHWVERLNKNEIDCEPVSCSNCSANMDKKIAKERCKRRSEILLLQVNTRAKKTMVSNIPRELIFVDTNSHLMKYKLITVVHHRANNDSTKSGHYWVNTVSHTDNTNIKRMVYISDAEYKYIEKADTIMPSSTTAYLLAYHLHDILNAEGDSVY